MAHALSQLFASDTPLQLAALIVGFLLWLGVGLASLRQLSWLRRALYVGGGGILGYYELHMTWYWFAAGVLCLLLAVGLDALSPSTRHHAARTVDRH